MLIKYGEMAVELKCSSGFLVDHMRSISTGCGSLPYKSIENIFKTQEPYGQSKSKDQGCSQNVITSTDFVHETDSLRRKRKRKRKRSLNSGERTALYHHLKIRETILSGVELLSKFDNWDKYFSLNTPDEPDKCRKSDYLQASSHNNNFLELVCGKVVKHHQSTLYPAADVSYKVFDLVNRLVSNEKDDSMLLSVDSSTYMIPSNSKFYLSDLSYFLKHFIQDTGGKKFNVIVIDPPWENKSVKRGAKYTTLPIWEIKKLPIPQLASDKAFVVVWVTNKQKYRKFVIEDLFPSWSCKLIGEWYWVKLTRKGEMVFDLDSPHKKPYEPLIIGQFETVLNNGTPCSQFVTKSSHKECETLDKDSDEDNKDENFMETIIPKTKIICSVPCSLHSRKPPLNDIFQEFLLPDATCIELFARNLLPNWTSWGNEVLKYQHLEYFESKKR